MIKRKAALAGLIIALTSICGCHKTPTKSPGSGTLPTFNPSDPGPGHHHGREHDREFKVYIYTDTGDPKQPCFADFPKAVLWKDKSPTTGNTQTVTWVSDDGSEYYVDFLQPKGSPFPGSNPIHVPAGGKKSGGNLDPNASGNTYYEYKIQNASKVDCSIADPGIYVKP